MEENNPYFNLGENPSSWNQWFNEWLFHSRDNFVNGGALYQALAPGEAQYSEWSQQMVATMYQNWYNSAPEQMKRAMQAGINPFVAASGIAGSDVGSIAAAPNSAENTLPSMVQGAASALSSLGGAVGNAASAYIGLRKLRHEIRNIDADTEQTFVEMGFSKLQSKALTTQLKYLDQKEQIGVWQALANFDKTKAEYSNLVANHRNIMADYDRILAQKDLLIAQKGEITALEELHKAEQARAEELTRFATKEREFFEAHGYKLGTPIYESLRDMMVSNGTFDLEKFGDEVSGYEGKIESAKEDARLDSLQSHTFAIEYARANGQNASDVLYGRIGSPADFAGRVASMLTNDVGKPIIKGIENLFKSSDAKSIRKDLRLILDSAYEQLERYPDDAKHIQQVINECTAALSMSNSELVDWWKTANK